MYHKSSRFSQPIVLIDPFNYPPIIDTPGFIALNGKTYGHAESEELNYRLTGENMAGDITTRWGTNTYYVGLF